MMKDGNYIYNPTNDPSIYSHSGKVDYIPILKQTLNMLLPNCSMFIDVFEATEDNHMDLQCDDPNCRCHIPF